MKIQGLDFGDIPQVVCLPLRSAQALSEYPPVWMPDPPKARLLGSAFRTLITFEALGFSRSPRQISGALGLPQQHFVGYRTPYRCVSSVCHGVPFSEEPR